MYLAPYLEKTQMTAHVLLRLFSECLDQNYIEFENSASCSSRYENGHLTIYFECSNGIVDWMNNLNFTAVPYKDMAPEWYAHRGFLNVWRGVKQYVSERLLSHDIKSVTTVGYSHGAALALLCHEYVWFHMPHLRDSIYGYGFGCPRVYCGSKQPELLNKRWSNFYVIRNVNDFVTHLPPVQTGFSHVGNLIEIGTKGRYSCYNCPDIEAHKSESYIEVLSEIEAGKAEQGITVTKIVL